MKYRMFFSKCKLNRWHDLVNPLENRTFAIKCALYGIRNQR